jgi:hypothetical protein
MKSSDNDRRCDHAVISSPRSMNWNLLPELRLTPTRKPTFSYRYNRLALTLVFECLGITSRSEQKPTAKGAQCDSCVSLPLVNFVGDGIIVQCRLAAIEHFAWRDKMLGASYAHLCPRPRSQKTATINTPAGSLLDGKVVMNRLAFIDGKISVPCKVEVGSISGSSLFGHRSHESRRHRIRHILGSRATVYRVTDSARRMTGLGRLQ